LLAQPVQRLAQVQEPGCVGASAALRSKVVAVWRGNSITPHPRIHSNLWSPPSFALPDTRVSCHASSQGSRTETRAPIRKSAATLVPISPIPVSWRSTMQIKKHDISPMVELRDGSSWRIDDEICSHVLTDRSTGSQIRVISAS
jgi:hypothetical protein